MRLVEQWPLDPLKSAERDFGAELRKRVAQAFSQKESSFIADPEKCDKSLETLQKINSNYYKTRYPFGKNKVGAFGLPYEQVCELSSDKALKEFEQDRKRKGFFKDFRFVQT